MAKFKHTIKSNINPNSKEFKVKYAMAELYASGSGSNKQKRKNIEELGWKV